MDKSGDINSIRKTFEELGCISEKVNDGYFSMEIPALVDYKLIKQKLDQLEQNEIIEYAEPCLADQHRINNNETKKIESRTANKCLARLRIFR